MYIAHVLFIFHNRYYSVLLIFHSISMSFVFISASCMQYLVLTYPQEFHQITIEHFNRMLHYSSLPNCVISVHSPLSKYCMAPRGVLENIKSENNILHEAEGRVQYIVSRIWYFPIRWGEHAIFILS